jgi:hypothetical protein
MTINFHFTTMSMQLTTYYIMSSDLTIFLALTDNMEARVYFTVQFNSKAATFFDLRTQKPPQTSINVCFNTQLQNFAHNTSVFKVFPSQLYGSVFQTNMHGYFVKVLGNARNLVLSKVPY